MKPGNLHKEKKRKRGGLAPIHAVLNVKATLHVNSGKDMNAAIDKMMSSEGMKVSTVDNLDITLRII